MVAVRNDRHIVKRGRVMEELQEIKEELRKDLSKLKDAIPKFLQDVENALDNLDRVSNWEEAKAYDEKCLETINDFLDTDWFE